MTSNAPYIPNQDVLASAWATNFASVIAAAPSTYFVSSPQSAAITAAAGDFATALDIATTPATRTSATIAAKDNARASCMAVLRPYAVAISSNPAISDEHKVEVGVTVRGGSPTPVPAPVVPPVISLMSATPLRQRLQITPLGASNKAKPPGAIAIELARTVGTTAATDPAQLQIIGQFGKTPLYQDFEAGQPGKIVTYAARYRTRSGPAGVSQAGPWSALAAFVVM